MTTSNVLSHSVQTAKLSFKTSKNRNTLFDVKVKDGPMGSRPTVMTGLCQLSPNGKSEDGLRGIASFKARHNSDMFSSLKLRLTNGTAGDVIKMCESALDAWTLAHDPVRQSSWYQSQFGLADGTKVHLATGAMANPDLYAGYAFEGNASYNSPKSTFFDVMYGDEEDTVWYHSFGIPTAKGGDWNETAVNSAVLVFRGEDGKAIKHKLGEDCPAIPTTGVPLTDLDTIRRIEQSSWFKDSRWNCKTAIQLSGLEWKLERDITSGELVLCPIFHLKVAGSILYMKTTYALPEGVVPIDERMSIMDAALFEGIEAPTISKKRKRSKNITKVSTKKGTVVDPDFSQDILLDDDIEGESE